MQRIFLFLLCAATAFSANSKKKVVILCSHGGYSHEGAAKTITQMLDGEYECKTIFPITEYRPCGVKNSEQIYNFLFARGWNRTIEWLTSFSTSFFKVRSSKFEGYFDKAFDREKPDLVISVAPIMNGPALRAAHKKKIPFLLTSLDESMWIWLTNFKKPPGAKFRFAVPRAGKEIVAAIEKTGILRSDIVEIGQLLRPEFQRPLPSKEILREKHGIPQTKRVVLIMMGGAGSDVCIAYAKKIAQIDLGAHIIVCTGRYEALAEDIERIVPCKSNTVQAMRFTNEMAELMGLSDLMILKPGPSAVFEAVSVGRAPLILDTTISPIAWEKSNVKFVREHQMGEEIRRVKYLPRLLRRYLLDTKERRAALEAFEKEAPNHSCEGIKELVHGLCPVSS